MKTQTVSVGGRRSKFYSRDARLDAIGPGKQQVSWMTWTGSIEPEVNNVISAVSSMVAEGLSLGGTLTAEPVPVSPLMLGRIFDGAYGRYRESIVNARADGTATDPDTVDVSEVVQHTLNLQNAIESGNPSARQIFDSLRKSCDAINSAHAAKATGDALGVRESTRVAVALGQFQAGAQRLWGTKPAQFATSDSKYSPGVVRDHLHAAHHATDMRDKVSALNDANKEFWKRNTADMNAPTPGQASGDGGIAVINAANARFWAARR